MGEATSAPAWALVEQLACRDLVLRLRAVAQLRTLGAAAAPALERGLAGHSRVEVRRWCAHLLQQAHRLASACAIVAATNDPVAAVRVLALQTLAGGPGRVDDLGLDPIPHLVRLAHHDRSKRVRLAALAHLGQRLHDPRARAAVATADARASGPWLLDEMVERRPVAAHY